MCYDDKTRAMVDIFFNIHMYLFLGCWGGNFFFWCIITYFWALFVHCSNPSLCSYGISSYKLDSFFSSSISWFDFLLYSQSFILFFGMVAKVFTVFWIIISLQLLQIWSNHPRIVVGKIGTTWSKPIFLELR